MAPLDDNLKDILDIGCGDAASILDLCKLPLTTTYPGLKKGKIYDVLTQR